MRPNELRLAIIKVLCLRRKDTMRNLAIEFGVSVHTIRYDIEILSRTFPLVTSKGHAGSVAVVDGCRYGDNYLREKQHALLVRVLEMLSGEDRAVVQSILDEFAPIEQVGWGFVRLRFKIINAAEE